MPGFFDRLRSVGRSARNYVAGKIEDATIYIADAVTSIIQLHPHYAAANAIASRSVSNQMTVEEGEVQNNAGDSSSSSGANTQSQNPENDNVVKHAAVFPVFRNRNASQALQDAWDLERTLRDSAGYNIWLAEGRPSLETQPCSTSVAAFNRFNTWFMERKAEDNVDGIFIMVSTHGYTHVMDDTARPKLYLEDSDTFDVISWLTDTLAGTNFPVIVCINSCRVNVEENASAGEETLPAAPNLNVQNNILLSWASEAGGVVEDSKFVKMWRYKIATDFMQTDIVTIARGVGNETQGGSMYIGLDMARGQCIGGVWESTEYLASHIDPEKKAALIQKCITFAKNAGKRIGKAVQNEEGWDIKRVPQGKMVALFENDSIAVVCAKKRDDESFLALGVAYYECPDNALEALLKRFDENQPALVLKKDIAAAYSSIEAFLQNCEQ